jgi:hypothetical protein
MDKGRKLYVVSKDSGPGPESRTPRFKKKNVPAIQNQYILDFISLVLSVRTLLKQ